MVLQMNLGLFSNREALLRTYGQAGFPSSTRIQAEMTLTLEKRARSLETTRKMMYSHNSDGRGLENPAMFDEMHLKYSKIKV